MGSRTLILLVDIKCELFESADKTVFPKSECMSEESGRPSGMGHGSMMPHRPPPAQVRPLRKGRPCPGFSLSLRNPICFFASLLGMKFPGLPSPQLILSR